MKQHLIALAKVVGILESNDVAYHLTGGLAGNVYGSIWPPHDIDLEVSKADFEKVAVLFSESLVDPPHRYLDAEFDLWLMTLFIEGIDVDINQVEDSFAITKSGARQSFSIELGRAQRHNFHGLEISVQPLEDIIEYKTLIGRSADVADLVALRK